MLCRILDQLQPSWVTSYHKHDSLLEHIDDEELSEEERKAAWANYNQQIESSRQVSDKQTDRHTDISSVKHILISFPRFDLQALEDRLASAAIPSAPTMAAAVPRASLALPPNGNDLASVFNIFKTSSDKTIELVRDILNDSQNLKRMEALFGNARLVPKGVQEQMIAIKQQRENKYRILGQYIAQLNNWNSRFLSSLAGNETVLAAVQKQRRMLYNELERLHQFSSQVHTSASGATVLPHPAMNVSAGVHPVTNTVRIRGNGYPALPTNAVPIPSQLPQDMDPGSRQWMPAHLHRAPLPARPTLEDQVSSTTGRS